VLSLYFSGLFENKDELTMRQTRAGWQHEGQRDRKGRATRRPAKSRAAGATLVVALNTERLLGGGPMTERSKEQTYPDAEIETRLKAELPHWYLENGWIRRRYRTSSWKGTLMVINTVGHLAEAAWHHPDITASYAWVEVRLQNHAAKGITDKDFELAKKIEEVIQWQPGKAGGALEGTPASDQRFAYIKYDS
jgi:4a-hydroxytetrahydrobiopterin dehydratase